MLNSGNKINAMTLAYVVKLYLISWITIVGTQKIGSLSLKTYKMLAIEVLIHNKLAKVWYFKKTFLLVETSIEVVLGMVFLFFSNTNLQFGTRKLIHYC